MSMRRSAPVTVWILTLLMYVTGAVLGVNLQAAEANELPHALAFNGSDSYVETQATAANMGIEGNHAKTVEAWVYTHSFNNGAVFSLGAQGSDGSDFTLRTQGRQNRWLATFWGGGIKFYHPSPDRWVHFALVYTGSEAIVYADGKEVGRSSRELDTHPDQPFRIGRRKDISFDGMIAEVRVWNRALSEQEIAGHIKKPLTGREDGLVGYWPMNRDEGNRVADRSSNNHHGKIVNAKWREMVIPAQIRTAPSERVVPPLVKRLTKHPSGRARMQAARGLGIHATAERVRSILKEAGTGAGKAKQVAPAVLLALEFYKNMPGAPEVAPVELASALLGVLHGGEQADGSRNTARKMLDGLDQQIGEVALAPVLLKVLDDAENTDPVRRGVLDGTGAREVTAAGIDEEAKNPYPETRAAIDRYKEFVIGTYHQEICAYPDTVTEVSTLEELFEYAGKSGVHVRMEPGVYEIGLDNVQELWDGTNGRLLEFSGDHSGYDLSGVEIRIDTYLYKNHSFRDLVKISGNHLIIQGLTVTQVGYYPPGTSHSKTMSQRGNNNLIQGVRLNTRGGQPYGYGHGLMSFTSKKQNALKVQGRHNVYADVDLIHRGNGHALYWGGDVDHTWIDCYIQGKSRLSDDILSKTEGAFYDGMSSLADGTVRKIKNELPKGRIIPLGEDAFRSYGRGIELKILGCTVEDVRSAIKRGTYDETVFISSSTFRSVNRGVFWMKSDVNVVNCDVDLGCADLMFFREADDSVTGELEITVLPNPHDHLPKLMGAATGLIGGHDMDVTLNAGEHLDVENVKEERSKYPIRVSGENHTIENHTGIPITLREDSKNCKVISNGDVTDNGTGNEIIHSE